MKSIGWGTWIRTKINGVRVRCSTVELCPTKLLILIAFRHFAIFLTQCPGRARPRPYIRLPRCGVYSQVPISSSNLKFQLKGVSLPAREDHSRVISQATPSARRMRTARGPRSSCSVGSAGTDRRGCNH
jgi:hypothetical protein